MLSVLAGLVCSLRGLRLEVVDDKGRRFLIAIA
jgi:hypothetical protein